jgi:tartrate dehydrogenase/decarboxylase/D-malate dehydrogenase
MATGSLGMLPSASLGAPDAKTGKRKALYEPVHGSAPDIAGKGIANPIGQIWSAALMLEHLGLPDQAARIVRAIEETTRSGRTTPDLGGSLRTEDAGNAIVAALG